MRGTMTLDPTQAWEVLEALPDPVFLVDGNGELVFSTTAAARLLGWDVDSWTGRSVVGLVHPDDLAMVLVSLESVQGKQVGNPIEVRIATADGEWRYLQGVGAPRTGVEGLGGIIIT